MAQMPQLLVHGHPCLRTNSPAQARVVGGNEELQFILLPERLIQTVKFFAMYNLKMKVVKDIYYQVK
ncbi:hypothetical protein CCACVL1_21819 [Corchorus capsularis]|uniref:Uncharacterized protein n=1 Tax=Corchorus capsularis TaxID=210143 RepID=A0A1R3H225_COCAP|nr:hypothetical protein CCACVL1_21819 [Corchorus capsularis]